MRFKLLDATGLARFLNKVKDLIPTKTSELQNDSGFITAQGTYDDELSDTSEKAVQNKVVKQALDTKADDSSVVHKTGNESISGQKSFTTVGYGEQIRFKHTGLDLSDGNPALTDTYQSTMHWEDNNGTKFSSIQSWTNSDNNTLVFRSRYKKDANTTITSSVRHECKETTKTVYPESNGDTDLGKSGNRWKSVYADNYYKGTTAFGDIITHNTSEFADASHTHTASDVSGLSAVATSGSYNDLSNKPTIPTVNNATLTIQKNGATVETFTANASSNVTCDISVPTKTSDLTNDSGFLTSHNPVDSALSSTSENAVQNKVIKQALDSKANDNSVVHTTGNESVSGTKSFNSDLNLNYSSIDVDDIIDSIPGLGTADDYVHISGNETINGIKTFSDGIVANVSGTATPLAHTHTTSDITNLSIPSKVSDLTNDSGFITGVSWNDVSGKPSSFTPSSHTHGSITNDGKLGTAANKPLITGANGVISTGSFGTSANTFCQGNDSRLSDARTPLSHTHVSNDITSLDASKLTGTIDIARLPKGALERLVTVADQTARFALTSSDVQLGDTVKQLDTGVMYIVSDDSKLSSSDGYTEYTAGSATSVPWSGVTGKPSSYTPASHTHGNIANGGTLGTASKVLITDSNKKITTSSVSDTELGYLSGVTSAIQTQISGKADSGHTHSASDITSGLATVATSGSYNDLSNKPTIPTVNNATLTIQKNGTTVKTFTANASSNVTANITVPTKTSDLTNDSHSTITMGTDSTSTASPAHGGTFTCIDSVTKDSNGHVTAVNVKTVTLPSDNNTDTLVTQNVSTANENHPILLTVTKDATANQGAKTSIFASGVKVNPSTNTVTATTFSGALSGNASSATQFSANKSVTLTGDVTGTASSKAGWSVATTLSDSGVTAGTYGPSADVTGNNNSTISVPEITVDSKGRVTSVANRTLTCKNNTYNVYNKTLTIQKNGTNVATFTSNSNTDVTANITVPTKVSELTNDSGFLTAHQSLSNYSTLANTVKSLSISGKTITVTPGSGSAYTLTTQDTVYTHPTTSGNKHIPSGGSSGQFLGWDSDGTAKWVNNPNSDTLMTQNVSTTNATYPLLLCPTANATANQGAKTGIFAKSVKVNPSTNALSATQLWSNSQTIQNSGFTKGTNPSAQSYWSMYMADKNGNDWATNCLGVFETTCDTSGNVTSVMKAVKNEANSGNAGAISVTYNKSANTVSTYAPTPATSDNSTQIATTAFVKAQGYLTSHQSLANYVTLNSQQYISGSKIFNVQTFRQSLSYDTGQSTATTDFGFSWLDKDGDTVGWANRTHWSNNYGGLSIGVRDKFKDGALNTSGDFASSYIELALSPAGVPYFNYNFYFMQNVTPFDNNSKTLGDSTHKWANVYATTFTGNVTGNCSGTSANVTGTVAIANGGTGATTRLNAVKALTNENVGTGSQYFLTITSNWGKAGYCSVADAKTVLSVPTKTSQLTNDSGFLTSHQSLSNYVTLDGSQTISGNKTFSSNLVYTNTLAKKHSSVTKGTNPSSIAYWTIGMCDKNGLNAANNGLGMFETSLAADGNVSTYLRAYKNTAGSTTCSEVRAKYNTTNDIGWINCTGEDICLISNKKTQGTVPTANQDCTFKMFDNSSHTMFEIRNRSVANSSSKQTYTTISVAPNTSGAGVTDAFRIYAQTENSSTVCNVLTQNFLPISNNTYALGDSSHKWKTAHAVNFYENGTALSDKYVQITQFTNKNISLSAGVGTIIFAAGVSTQIVLGQNKTISAINLYMVSDNLLRSTSNGYVNYISIEPTPMSSGTWTLLTDGTSGVADAYVLGYWKRTS